MPRVHVFLQLDSSAEARATARFAEDGLSVEFLRGSPELTRTLPEIEYLLVGRPPRLDWSPASRLELLQIAGTGVDPLFPAVGLRDSAIIANFRGVQADAVRDHVLALLLAFARDLPRAFGQQARREWRRYPASALTGKSLVLLGYGDIGKRVAKVALAIGMRVRAVCRSERSAPELDGLFGVEHLSSALSDADYLVVAVPLTSQTRALVNARVLDALPPQAVVINVARGGVMDEAALEAALRNGRIAGAALDVFAGEPLPSTSSLWSCPNLLVTPHIAGFTPDYYEALFHDFSRNVALHRRGEAPFSVVSRSDEY